MLLTLNRIARHLPCPSNFGHLSSRRVRHHVGQAVARRSTSSHRIRVETRGSVINPSIAQDERNGRLAFPPRHVCPSHSKPFFLVTLFPPPTKSPTARHKFHRIRSHISPILPPLYPTIDPSPSSSTSRFMSPADTRCTPSSLRSGWGARDQIPAVSMVWEGDRSMGTAPAVTSS